MLLDGEQKYIAQSVRWTMGFAAKAIPMPSWDDRLRHFGVAALEVIRVHRRCRIVVGVA